MNDFWVFGYASLMWRPGFEHVEVQRATLRGYHRSLCIHSWEHRGTRKRPGLVMGLDRGGTCVGLCLRVPGHAHDDVMAYLRERELITHVYVERHAHATLADGRRVAAVTYVADRSHPQYAGRLDVDAAARQVFGAIGQAGPNEDYVFNTLAHIHELGLRDRWLEAVAKRIRQLQAGS